MTGLESKWVGLTRYSQGEKIQQEAWSSVKSGSGGLVLGFEFEPVITMGKRACVDSDVVSNRETLRQRQISLEFIDRGGHATLHSPGQLVIYPVLDLKVMGWGVRDYVCWLMKVTQACLLEFGVNTHLGAEPGIYSENGKIAFVGIRVRNGITQHGISINVSNDLDLFANIRSCGLSSERFDRVCDHFEGTQVEEIYRAWLESAGPIFQANTL